MNKNTILSSIFNRLKKSKQIIKGNTIGIFTKKIKGKKITKTIYYVEQNGLSKFMEYKFGIKMIRNPDEAYIIKIKNNKSGKIRYIIKILEKKTKMLREVSKQNYGVVHHYYMNMKDI